MIADVHLEHADQAGDLCGQGSHTGSGKTASQWNLIDQFTLAGLLNLYPGYACIFLTESKPGPGKAE